MNHIKHLLAIILVLCIFAPSSQASWSHSGLSGYGHKGTSGSHAGTSGRRHH